MNRDELQKMLPSRLILLEPIGQEGKQGWVFKAEDRRLPDGKDAKPPRRAIRFVSLTEIKAEKRQRLFERVRQVAAENLPHVSRPLETGLSANGDVMWIVSDWFPSCLATHLTRGLTDAVAWSVLRKLARGLSELHRQGIAHGDLRPENIFLDTSQVVRNSAVYIGDVCTGSWAYLSDGVLKIHRMGPYADPAWNHQLQPPSKSADVYALGRIGIEMLIGRVEPDVDLEDKLKNSPCAWHKRLDRACRRTVLLAMIKDDQEQRPSDGEKVQERINAKDHKLKVMAAAVVLFFAVFGGWLFGDQHSQAALKERADEAAKLKKEKQSIEDTVDVQSRQLRTAEIEIGNLLRDKDELKKENDQLKTSRGPQSPLDIAKEKWAKILKGANSTELDERLKALTPVPPAEQLNLLSGWKEAVQQAWAAVNDKVPVDASRGGSKADPPRKVAYYEFRKAPWDMGLQTALLRAWWIDHWDQSCPPHDLLKPINAATQKLPVSNWLRIALREWHGSAAEARNQWLDWLSVRHADLCAPYFEVIRDPLNPEKKGLAERQLKGLNQAREIWTTHAGKTNLTWEQFKERMRTDSKGMSAGTGNDDAGSILARWISDIEKKSDDSKWGISLESGATEAGWGTWRSLTIYLSSSAFASKSAQITGDWKNETSHDYGNTENRAAEFAWQPGQPIRFLFESSSLSGLSNDLIDKTFDGPVAIWRLAQEGRIENSDKSRFLAFTIDDCPGPPLKKSVIPRVIPNASGSAKSASNASAKAK
ncbi:MAG: hypothetical protein NT013_21675 [Planctomycetia bacterium]|nr:hypothetical protein [Planctomycetia bacterium]